MTEVNTLTYEELEAVDENGRFATLNAKLAVSLTGVMHGEFNRKTQLMKEKTSDQGKQAPGRQILWMIYDRSRSQARTTSYSTLPIWWELVCEATALQLPKMNWSMSSANKRKKYA